MNWQTASQWPWSWTLLGIAYRNPRWPNEFRFSRRDWAWSWPMLGVAYRNPAWNLPAMTWRSEFRWQ